MADPTGLSAALIAAGAGESLLPEDAEQLDLLGLRSVAADRRGRGRPLGSRNLKVQAVADYLLSKYRDPLEGLVQMAGAGVEELAAALGCSRLEAFGEKRQCIIAALPYLHRRQPLAIDMSVKAPVYLTVVDTPLPVGVALADVIVEVVQNQRLMENDDGSV